MTRLKLLALMLAVIAVGTCRAPAQAGELVDEMHIGFWRNNCWPRPFIYPDRKAAFAPMAIMADNGWRRHNLLGTHHFSPDGTQLTMSGELKVRWILTQAPAHRRNVFVERANDALETGRRIDTVHSFAGVVAPEGIASAVSVYDTHIQSEGRPAMDVDWSMVKFRENAPLPKLPEREGITALND